MTAHPVGKDDLAPSGQAPGAAPTAEPDLDHQETYWQPFRYTPSEDDALCFGCERWLAADRFARDQDGIPGPRCRECEAAAEAP